MPGVSVGFQRKFRLNSAGPLRSVSFEMRPDITLESAGRLLILDPKYRVGYDGLIDGLGAMHRYRDGIVGTAGERAVAGAYLLCPAPPATEADEKRYLSEAYQDQWGMRICVLRPGGDGPVAGVGKPLSQPIRRCAATSEGIRTVIIRP